MPGNGGYPPGTIPPPPSTTPPGKPPQQRQQGKIIGSSTPGLAGSTPPVPPPGSTPAHRAKEPAAPTLPVQHPEIPEAFRPPPPATPSVLDNRVANRRRSKAISTDAAAAAATSRTTPGAVPPLLANPRVQQSTEGVRPPSTSQRRGKSYRKLSEFETGVAEGTSPVFEGRVGPVRVETAEPAGDVPVELRGASAAAAEEHDRQARPQAYADRTTRSVVQGEHTGPAVTKPTWEVRTPGGPVVSSATKESKYRPEQVSAIEGRH